MNLTLIDKNALQALKTTFKVLVEPRLGQAFKTLSKATQMQISLNAVTMLHSKTGDKGATDTNVLQYQSADFLGEVVGLNSELTENEIYQACSNLYRGDYGQFFGLNAKTYAQLLKGYRLNEDRGKAWLACMDEVEKQNKPKEMTNEEKIELGKRGAIARFEHYKQTGELGFIPSATYNILNDLIGVEYDHPQKGKVKTLVTDKEVRIRIFTEVKDNFIADKNKQRSRAVLRKDSEMVKDIDVIISTYFMQPNFENTVKDNMLKHYFDELIKQNKNLDI